MDKPLLKNILQQFKVDTTSVSFTTINQGYINDTFLVSINNTPTYILQRINVNVFKDAKGLHNNIELALKQLKHEKYHSIALIKTNDDKPFYSLENDIWRILTYVEDSVAYNHTSNNTIAFEAGRIIGCFHSLLQHENTNDYPDTLPLLNYLPFRITEFNEALKNTSNERKTIAKTEVDFALENLTQFDAFYKADLPLRVCHNDTKLNNILFHKDNSGLCLIDLDTIMKGYFHYDFGDAVRTAVSQSNEDEKDLSKIKFNLDLFKSFIEGLNNNDAFLTAQEISYLPIACALMPFMHGLRALTDYLNGNIYYKVAYENQNLDRCRSLFRFSQLALENKEAITSIINNELA